jgi:hypothetical protein
VATFFLLTALGFACRLRAVSDGVLDRPAEVTINVAGHVALAFACLALFSFTQRAFRPAEGWARTLLRAASVVSVAALALLFVDGGVRREDAPSLLALNALRAGAFGWSFVEATLYWRQMRRRLALGLAEPLVTNRFLLWSIWTGGLALCFAFVLLLRIAGRITGVGAEAAPAVFPLLQAVLGASIFCSAAAVWLCFFPPARYRAWVASRAASA